MIRWRWWHVSTVILILVGGAGSAIAQSSGGYANTELSRIRNRDIGSGYSIDSINRSTLARAQARVQDVGQSSAGRASYGNLGLSSPRRSKPFSHVSTPPTVSPYLNLFREDLGGNSDLNYDTLVRPQLEQQRVNEQVQRQNIELARHVQSIAAQSAYNPSGSRQIYPTGHQTTFYYYGHYYPSASGRGR